MLLNNAVFSQTVRSIANLNVFQISRCEFRISSQEHSYEQENLLADRHPIGDLGGVVAKGCQQDRNANYGPKIPAAEG